VACPPGGRALRRRAFLVLGLDAEAGWARVDASGAGEPRGKPCALGGGSGDAGGLTRTRGDNLAVVRRRGEGVLSKATARGFG
jgi:hypothetical protein